MLLSVYTVCAVLGGTILVVQFLLSVVGLSQDHDMDAGHGHDFDTGHDFDHGHVGDAGDAVAGDNVHFDADTAAHEADAHDSSWFFRLLSFRSLVGAIAFFGVGGGMAQSSGLSGIASFPVALGAGVIAMVAVAWLMHLLINLREEGNVRIGEAIGCPATVYLRIPGGNAGAGKVTVDLQHRSMEYEAITNDAAELPTGSHVVVVNVVNENTLEVKQQTS